MNETTNEASDDCAARAADSEGGMQRPAGTLIYLHADTRRPPAGVPAATGTPADAPVPAGADALSTALNAVLETMRAILAAARDSAREAQSPQLRALVAEIRSHADRWSLLLCHHIQTRGALPSPALARLHTRAMRIADLPARLAMLNLCQEELAVRLDAIIGMAEDETLYADLIGMRRSFEAIVLFTHRGLGQARPPR